MLAVELERARPDPAVVALRLAEATDVDRPEVHGRFARHDPLGERASGAARRGDAERIEAAADVEACELRRLAEDEVAVGRERLRAVDQLLDARPLERRYAQQSLLHQRLEVIPVRIEQGEVEAIGDAVRRPGDRVRLVAAHDQPADLLLEIDQAVGVAERRQVGRDAGDRLGDHVLVLHRGERHAHPGKAPERPGPLARTQHDDLGGDFALLGDDARDPAALSAKAGDGAAFDDPHTVLPRALGQRLGDVGGIGLAVGWQVRSPDQVGDVHQRPEILGFGGREQVHLEAEAVRGGRLALELDHPIGGAGEPQAAVHLPAARLAGLGLQPLVQLDAVLQELGHVGIGPELPDETGGVPGRAAGQLLSLEQHHLPPAEPGQMIGDRAAHDAAAYDHDPAVGGQAGHLPAPDQPLGHYHRRTTPYRSNKFPLETCTD